MAQRQVATYGVDSAAETAGAVVNEVAARKRCRILNEIHATAASESEVGLEPAVLKRRATTVAENTTSNKGRVPAKGALH